MVGGAQVPYNQEGVDAALHPRVVWFRGRRCNQDDDLRPLLHIASEDFLGSVLEAKSSVRVYVALHRTAEQATEQHVGVAVHVYY